MTDDLPLPFRWNLTQREALGSLIHGPMAPSYPGFEDDLLVASARVIAFSANADLCFVGRSLESMFDLLSGLLSDTSWTDRLTLLPFSSRLYDVRAIIREEPNKRRYLWDYFEHMGLHPRILVQRQRPVALVDIVASGGTFSTIIKLIHAWCNEEGRDWKSVARRLRLVGVTVRTHTSPNTWRWQQHASWVSLLPTGTIKNVSVPPEMAAYLAGEQAKTTWSFSPTRWGMTEVTTPSRHETILQALRLAVHLLDVGRQEETRDRFRKQLTTEPAMTEPWFRSLIQELRR